MWNTDDATVNFIAKSLQGEDLVKAMHRAGLVYVQKQVSVKGKTYTKGFWVRPDEAKKFKKEGTDMKETKDLHHISGSNGKYVDNRHDMHMEIINKVVNSAGSPKKGQKPIAILMGGGSASGKSTMREAVIEKELEKRGIKVGTVDADEIKKEIPEYSSLKETHPDDAARIVHEESSDIGALMIDTLIKKNKHFIYDGTMGSTKKYEKLVDRLKKAGYEVHAYVADVPIEVAKERSDARAKDTGRKVPHHIIEGSHKGVPKTVEAIKDKIDSYRVYDNQDKLKLIASNNHVDPEMYSKFLDKAGIKYSAKANA